LVVETSLIPMIFLAGKQTLASSDSNCQLSNRCVTIKYNRKEYTQGVSLKPR